MFKNKKGFSIIDIFLVISLVAFVGIFYFYYQKKTTEQIAKDQISREVKEGGTNEGKKISPQTYKRENIARDIRDSEVVKSEQAYQSALERALAGGSQVELEKETNPDLEERINNRGAQKLPNGFYHNDTYGYEVTCPADWQLRVPAQQNVIIGTVPPKDGRGALTIEVSAGDVAKELEEGKAEAAKYPGLVKVDEEAVTVDGVSGTRIIFHNSLARSTEVYIWLKKNGLNYLLKYSEESPLFVEQVKKAIETFKFDK